MKIAVDRIEGEFAVCIAETGGRDMVFNLPALLFPSPPREGEIYELSLVPDENERKSSEERIKNKLTDLFNKK